MTERRRPYRLLLMGLVVSAALLAPATARADVGITHVNPTSASPGQFVTVHLGCGFVCGPWIPVSLVPIGKAPQPHPCLVALSRADRRQGRREKAICTPTAKRLPRARPYFFLGRATETEKSRRVNAINRQLCGCPDPQPQSFELRFHVPAVKPGVYAFVAYCCPSMPGHGRRGSLITNTNEHKNLRVHRQSSSMGSDSSEQNDSFPIWLIAGAGIAAILAGGIGLRLRPRGSI